MKKIFTTMLLLELLAMSVNVQAQTRVYTYPAKILCSYKLTNGGVVLAGVITFQGHDAIVLGSGPSYNAYNLLATSNDFFGANTSNVSSVRFNTYSAAQSGGNKGSLADPLKFMYSNNQNEESLFVSYPLIEKARDPYVYLFSTPSCNHNTTYRTTDEI